MVKAFFACLLLMGIFFAQISSAVMGPFPAANLATIEDADAFARTIVSRYQTDAAATGKEIQDLDPILIFHIGEAPPKPLQWILLHLESAKIPVQLEMVTEAEMEQSLDLVQDKALEVHHLTYGYRNETQKNKSIRSAWKSAKLKLKHLFGLPRGLTAWVKLDRSKRLKYIEGGMATMSSLISGASVAFTFYLTERAGTPVNELRAGVVLAACVWYFLYEARRFSEIMGQAKVVKEKAPGEFVASESVIFRYTATAMRSFFMGSLVIGAAFGMERFLTAATLHQLILNTAVNMFARSWIDDWLGRRMPTIEENGHVQIDPSKGQWNLPKWIAVNSVWNIFYGFGKNVHLLGLGDWADATYYILGSIGVTKLVYDERYTIKRRLREFWDTVFSRASLHTCESLLALPAK